MRDQPETARNGGRISEPVYFIHANHRRLAAHVPATIVQVCRCQIYPDGRADVLLVPTNLVWLELIWERPNTNGLFYAQALRQGTEMSPAEAEAIVSRLLS